MERLDFAACKLLPWKEAEVGHSNGEALCLPLPEDHMARRKYDRARKGARGAPGHIDDVAIGDEVCFSSILV